MANLHLDRSALERIVRERAGEATKRVAEEIADKVRAQRITVGDRDGGKNEYDLPEQTHKHEDGTADVVLAHPAGKAAQAKHGALTRAAAAAGFEVHG